jgi:hypothetical protein
LRLGLLSALSIAFVSGAVAEEETPSQLVQRVERKLIELVESMPPSETVLDTAPFLETYRMHCVGLPNSILFPEPVLSTSRETGVNAEAVKMTVSSFQDVQRTQFLQVVAFDEENNPILRSVENESGSPLLSAVWYVRARDVACSLKGPGQL